jgi:hypothetical protein
MRLLTAIALSLLLSGCLASLPVDPVPPMDHCVYVGGGTFSCLWAQPLPVGSH